MCAGRAAVGCGRRALCAAAALLLAAALLALLVLVPGSPRCASYRLRPRVKAKQLFTGSRVEIMLGEKEARRLWLMPLEYRQKHYKQKTCAPLPAFLELEFYNTYWQTLRSSNSTYHMYSAYLDTRDLNQLGPAVRVLAVLDRLPPNDTIYCQLWFEEKFEPQIVRTLPYRYMWNRKWGNHRDGVLQPYLIACVLPPAVRHLVPASVSLVELPCDRATNNLRVQYDAPLDRSRHEFAVCVKGLDFLHKDISVRLVEWIELVHLLGAHKIFFYVLQVHRNITKVLKYYEILGIVSVTHITMPGAQPHSAGRGRHKRQMELIPYNDCLYRNMYHYRWLVLLDVDEVIVPLKDEDWSSLMRRVLPMSKPAAGKPTRSSYYASNVYFFHSFLSNYDWDHSVPRYMYMLQHAYRVRNFTSSRENAKSFFETDRVLMVHNHFPLSCLAEMCSSYPIPTDLGRLQHYRVKCHLKKCKEVRAQQPARDWSLLRWRQPLLRRAAAALRVLALLPAPHSDGYGDKPRRTRRLRLITHRTIQ